MHFLYLYKKRNNKTKQIFPFDLIFYAGMGEIICYKVSLSFERMLRWLQQRAAFPKPLKSLQFSGLLAKYQGAKLK